MVINLTFLYYPTYVDHAKFPATTVHAMVHLILWTHEMCWAGSVYLVFEIFGIFPASTENVTFFAVWTAVVPIAFSVLSRQNDYHAV